jgi:GLPGLI family protein
MKHIFISFILLSTVNLVQSQQFINSGMIEFEVRVNNHRVFGNEGIFADIIRQRAPQFSTTYYKFFFNDDKALYKFDRYDMATKMPAITNTNLEDDVWYNEYKSGKFIDQKFVFDNTYLLSGALMKIDWKLTPTETREIAGFNCRKATGIIFDSVYVFAFYTDEITISGGPMGLSGLPGMILGVTIPRMYTSWIATKLQFGGVDAKTITAPKKGKTKDPLELKTEVEKVSKNWGNYSKQMIWQMFL